jgi:epothilone polyketide synthase D
MGSVNRHKIAIVGAAGRFPRAGNLREYWSLLLGGGVAASEPPESRRALWRAARDPVLGARITTLKAGYLEPIAEFDAEYFKVSPREAARLDPQQRLLLEVTHDALEDGGITRSELQRHEVGVFVGAGSVDYMVLESADKASIDSYYGIGNSHNLLAGRISYHYNLKGPSFAVDTACSSSLTALHVACRSLEAGEIDLAVVGGVNLILTPDLPLAFSQARMLSPTGRCQTFAAAADGYGRAEGIGVVVLRRLPESELPRHVVRGVIASTAINQDGRSNGIAAPNGNSQVRVVRAALEKAGIRPDDLAYVEAHGTGTPLGDAIEIGALQQVFAHSDGGCFVGSAKASIGHAEAAAGMGGLLKAMLMLEHGTIPPHPVPGPYAPALEAGGPLKIADRAQPMPPGRRYVGVSSFGFGGSNAHIVLERYETVRRAEDDGRPVLLALSSHFDEGLVEDASALGSFLEQVDVGLHPVARTLQLGREHASRRWGVVARSRAEAVAALRAPEARRETASAGGEKPKVAMVFTGQGSQYTGMGRALYDRVPCFRNAFERCDALVSARSGRSMAQALYGRDPASDEQLARDTHLAQLALFTFEYALAQLWIAMGVTPFFAIGHSLGEIVAHTVAGSLALADGVALVHERGLVMQQVQPAGAMVAVSCDASRAVEIARELGANLDLAACNASRSVVLAGSREAVARFAIAIEGRGIRARMLRVSHAFHSPAFAEAAGELARRTRSFSFAKGAFPVAGNVDGALVCDESLDGEYWARHLVMPVQFAKGVAALVDAGALFFLEVGPDRVLSQLIAVDHPGRVCAVSSAARDSNLEFTMLRAMAALFVAGVDLDFEPWMGEGERGMVSLPARRLRRDRFWTPSEGCSAPASGQPTPRRVERVPCGLERADRFVFRSELSPCGLERADRFVFRSELSPSGLERADRTGTLRAVIDRQLTVMKAQLALFGGRVSPDARRASRPGERP